MIILAPTRELAMPQIGKDADALWQVLRFVGAGVGGRYGLPKQKSPACKNWWIFWLPRLVA